MINGKKFLGITPARGGSKRLPRKNVLELAGRPLIAWTIDAGLDSKYIDKLIVSSDDDEILSISRKCGSSIINRPPELASDISTTYEAVMHVLKSFKQYDYIVLLQATSPLRNSQHIDNAIETLINKKADAVISVCEMDHSPLWSNIIPEDGNMNSFVKDEIKGKRSQDLETYYRLNGAIYICDINRLLEEKTFFIKDNIFSYEMDKRDSVDIDDDFDFLLSELILKQNQC